MCSGNDTWDMRCALRPIDATRGCVANGHRSPAVPDIVPGCFSTNYTTGANFPNNCRMASFTDVDLTGVYHYNEHIDFLAGVLNLFDRKPPLNPIDYAGLNYNPTYAQVGIVGRFFKLGVHVKF